ncbi:MAG: universal stress protein [Methanobacterium sp.]|jgi:nucleotide-binding universal stress UspA family protein
MYKKILLPIDGSDNSNRATEHAINIADVNNSDIIVLFVVEPYYPKIPLLISTLPTPGENYYKEVEDEGEKIINDFKKNLEENQCKGKCKNTHITSLIKEGKAYIEIFNTIDEEKVDLVIMGASGRHSTLDRFMLGSVTERVIREARVPVMVIP